ncbi:stonin 2 [Cichlidogyrus casuarinus]|uniref:Stonin 2 n=1 Tax=Cichlidogyrus casuarinus TaxID=1844966 RepID=A0ABD2Q4Y7_9PLAT
MGESAVCKNELRATLANTAREAKSGTVLSYASVGRAEQSRAALTANERRDLIAWQSSWASILDLPSSSTNKILTHGSAAQSELCCFSGPLPSDPDPHFGLKSHFGKKKLLPNAKKGLQNILSGESKKERLKRKEREELERIINSGAPEPETESKPKGNDESWQFLQDLTARVTASVEDTVSKITVLSINSTVDDIGKGVGAAKKDSSDEENEKPQSEPGSDAPKEEQGWASFDPKAPPPAQAAPRLIRPTGPIPRGPRPHIRPQLRPRAPKPAPQPPSGPSIASKFLSGNPLKPSKPANAIRLESQGPRPRFPGPVNGQPQPVQPAQDGVANWASAEQQASENDWADFAGKEQNETSSWANFAEAEDQQQQETADHWANFGDKAEKEENQDDNDDEWAKFGQSEEPDNNWATTESSETFVANF